MTDGTTIWKNIWPIVLARSQQGWRCLMAPRDPITWAALRAKLTTLSLPSTNAGRLAVLAGIVLLLLLVLPWYAKGHKDEKGVVTYPNAAIINPILAGLGAILLIYAAIRQAQTASDRHEAQTKADLQRRITESFSKAVEQLGSDKLEVRLGSIYSLERISKESPDDYWTVMENLTAFVRERSRRNEAERTSQDLEQRISRRAYFLWVEAGQPDGRAEEFWAEAAEQEEFGEPATDIAAVLTVIKRRSEQSREREGSNDWRLDLNGMFLKRGDLRRTHLKRAIFTDAHLERAEPQQRASRAGQPEGRASRGGLPFFHAHLEEADLFGAHLERADFRGAVGLLEAQLRNANGDAETKLPKG